MSDFEIYQLELLVMKMIIICLNINLLGTCPPRSSIDVDPSKTVVPNLGGVYTSLGRRKQSSQKSDLLWASETDRDEWEEAQNQLKNSIFPESDFTMLNVYTQWKHN